MAMKKFDNDKIKAIATWLFSNMNEDSQNKFLAKNPINNAAAKDIDSVLSNGVNIGQLGSLGMSAATAHPLTTLGLGALTAGNLSGLTDNDKWGGQAGGAFLGGVLGNAIAPGFGTAVGALGGGELGALFDKLRSKREQQSQYRGY